MSPRAITTLLILLSSFARASAQTYEASSAQSKAYQAAFAFDGDTKTRWSSAFGEHVGWVQVTWDEARTHSRVRIHSGIADLKGAPQDFDILAGEPGSLQLVRQVKGNQADDVTFEFPKTTARTWRIDVKWRINPQWSPTITEITFGDEASLGDGDGAQGVEVQRPQATASDTGRPGRGPAQAFDGNDETCYEAKSSK
ncbi:MAG: discoidin domain-containing protein, partial [Phycisphaerales bacterium]|nr:discoidin domain-containing protein [Phycisphaerales bacterium]